MRGAAGTCQSALICRGQGRRALREEGSVTGTSGERMEFVVAPREKKKQGRRHTPEDVAIPIASRTEACTMFTSVA